MNTKYLKSKITHSPLHKPLKNLLALRDKKRINRSKPELTPTVYILSPYKTGTTYIDSLWEDSVSQHEPCQVYSLRFLDENFELNFKKRASYLNLKMECSGFLSLFLDKLPQADEKNGIRYFYVLRPPSKWVYSVLSHFMLISDLGYNFIDQFYWHKLLGYSMVEIFKTDNKEELEKLVNDLYKVYFELLEKAFANRDINFVKIEHLNDLAEYLEEQFDISPNFDRSWKRRSKLKFDKVETKYHAEDVAYEKFVQKIPKERLFPLEVND